MTLTLIINADDFGYESEVTRGIVQALEAGVVSSTTMMVNTPNSAAAGALARSKAWPIGLHFNLSRFAPLSSQLGPGDFNEARAVEQPSTHLAAELRAQLDRLEALVGRPATHIDVHRHLHTHAKVFEAIVVVALERSLPVRSVDERMRKLLKAAGVRTNDVFVGDAGTEAYWTPAQLSTDLASLPAEGVVELMCHPGYAPKAFSSGYGAQREVELATFCSPRSKAMLAAAGLTSRGWR